MTKVERVVLHNAGLSHEEQHIYVLGPLHEKLRTECRNRNVKDKFSLTIKGQMYDFEFTHYTEQTGIGVVLCLDGADKLRDLLIQLGEIEEEKD